MLTLLCKAHHEICLPTIVRPALIALNQLIIIIIINKIVTMFNISAIIINITTIARGEFASQGLFLNT